jgi:outer membrane protein TolC
MQAASAERYPTLSAVVNYGDTGTNLGSSHGTVSGGGELRLPIFEGGRIHGDNLVAASRLTSAKQQLGDLHARIDQEVRDAFLDLQDTAQEVAVEKNAVELANETLEQSRDRFASGVTDNIEVVQAQESLADANDAYIAALYRYNTAKISLARAVGLAESNYALYLKGQ